jgi:hypothetical protein
MTALDEVAPYTLVAVKLVKRCRNLHTGLELISPFQLVNLQRHGQIVGYREQLLATPRFSHSTQSDARVQGYSHADILGRHICMSADISHRSRK